MSTISSSLATASNALDVMEQAMAVIQNNVANASTPGYVTQTLSLETQPFDPSENLWGGVRAGDLQSSRNQYAEENVWNQSTLLGSSKQQASSLSALENIFGISAQSGIPSALSSLYAAFSAWSSKPTDATAQQQVLYAAQNVAQSFNQAATRVQQVEQQTNGQLQNTVDQINQLTAQIASLNGQIRAGGAADAGLQVHLYNTLEQLSSLTNIQVRIEGDGTASVLMDGQVPLVLGTTQQKLQTSYPAPQSPAYPGAIPDAHIISESGHDVTSHATGGELDGLLQFRNSALPSIIGNGSQQGSLNQLVQAFADRINGLLTSGTTSDGTAGVPLFSYSAATPTSAAATLSVNASVTASQLAPVDPGPPLVANGIATALAGLSASRNPADMVNGQSYTDFYGSIATAIGSEKSNASITQTTQTDLLAQAQNLRAQVSGVSLNDQAANLLQFQQAYEASARMISVINQTTQYLLQTVAQL
jgi:flagellar hook-associated protein 1